LITFVSDYSLDIRFNLVTTSLRAHV